MSQLVSKMRLQQVSSTESKLTTLIALVEFGYIQFSKEYTGFKVM